MVCEQRLENYANARHGRDHSFYRHDLYSDPWKPSDADQGLRSFLIPEYV